MPPWATGNLLFVLKYPYYIVPDVDEYKKLDPQSDEAKRLAVKIAANVGDPESLRRILGESQPQGSIFYDLEEESEPSFATIDNFLEKFGRDVPAAGYIAEEEKDESEVLNIGKRRKENKKPSDRDALSVLIKTGCYEEALELIENKNLNNTEKSIYFAHQIRFLKKLIKLKNYRNQTTG